ncbi:hypothetical protein MPL1_11803 [Methylophaga lonarensis MPL]|uniref:DUF3429 domain-containing protein n=1 Tax=Methylophaga lonarensis MPL TaxID=1286106 RepID=M7PNT3_9GAMM|nr:DUF3429 family protein [Methylophaga lonarensis]EMR12129.1 hypothetical protein MPL1_11803 [Methylophaga lonarensis MPL]
MTKLHKVLGYAGLLPFLVLSLLVYSDQREIEWMLRDYSALIFSFLGGLLWLSSTRVYVPAHVAVVAVSCMLWAWCWLIVPQFFPLWLLAASFLALLIYEMQALSAVYSDALMSLRKRLSLVAALSLLFAAFA